ncbi:membrane-binding protein [Ornithobacterium rhinotracheale]|uniref:Membrane-binding protein n=1 Tax=Ornithobacterium rhinotracheale (strain ATCC 51463 / DSM 15997 / CCUG 23171 / CIP 104009 / LMG 9086) TaxID=867902 RepID=I4A0S1_ORNRL|nr:hypothetical protein [Ornithobacterium rhinotracheale]AFL97555.1 hypothetical protein Ornrh_1382 [Ornithobacterium rhinotracheale DSM 15997]AIP98922.1 BAR domain protein [Ornithobacterium rhinotracheale ORT-UMN 88]KGB66869.1 BAR domain protein [Ornithobacterium rhinotracheale H06-030791]MBN3661888.1 membrane-binding protein [Ornithobacterium rhinotracheale]MCK0195079.1 membrane-binding protein [Ornithobacterium rhinotracheale]
MARKSYSESITSAKVMIDALKNNKGSLPQKLDDDFITKMENLRTKAETLNTEQEKLKADLKQKTEALDKELKELEKHYAEAKKRIKLDFPQTAWKEFGIEDKR